MENPIGKVITNRLDEMEKTQDWLAEMVGVSNNAVTKWIRTGGISIKNLPGVAKHLNITTDRLLGIERRQEVNEFKRQLIYFYDGMTPDHREDLLDIASKFYIRDNPDDRTADPFKQAAEHTKKTISE